LYVARGPVDKGHRKAEALQALSASVFTGMTSLQESQAPDTCLEQQDLLLVKVKDQVTERSKWIYICIRKCIASKLKEVILHLNSALVRSHLECWVQVWAPQYKKDTDLLK